MTADEVGRLFLSMEKEVRVAARKWVKGKEAGMEASHDALAILLAHPENLSPESAPAAIITAVEQAAFLAFQQRKEWDARHPTSRHWRVGGRPLVQHQAHEHEHPVEVPAIQRVADTRPSPEEEVIRAEAEAAIAALAARLGHDASWRGDLYLLQYVEGLNLAECARRLGISHAAARQRARRLRDYLRGTQEGVAVLKGRDSKRKKG